MRLGAFLVGVSLVWSAPLAADEAVDRLASAMRIDEVVGILREEGLSYARDLDQDMLGGSGGSFFESQVEIIYATEAMKADLRNALDVGLTPGQIEQAALFFESDLGQMIIALENSARRAFSDDAVEEMAKANYAAVDRNSALFLLVDEYVQINDLVEQNLNGTLSADFNFLRGVADGQDVFSDDAALLSTLLTRKDETRKETEDWLYGFLLMAYQPLSEAQLRENIAFSRTEAGKALNTALFEGFDRMYDRISFELGFAVGGAMTASDL
ncbi:DUF2059 domain-containing protein [Ruegeria sediminis]|uniref:DUF2059 domain-containing protein n=1 Tax=Ruegeria sediminis TaxID=2583820 RepID=A0ABY2X036_9RHOB|nr:DUF2059 domain-containing protein [Ruegeria sediminis]TMV08587.1 DUF2059 domain-containing protein [Ruegeria sediminis]